MRILQVVPFSHYSIAEMGPCLLEQGAGKSDCTIRDKLGRIVRSKIFLMKYVSSFVVACERG